MKELIEIQAELRVPKNQRNNFGGYNYRSAEDITEAAKPVIHRHGCHLQMSDAIEVHGNRVFLASTATLTNATGEKASCVGIAELAESKKGMDAAQLTGATSSYARKYALGGLFSLDDNRDSDALPTDNEPPKQTRKPEPPPEMSAADKQLAFMAKLGVTQDMAEMAIGKDFKDFDAEDNRFLKEVFVMMMREKFDFETAVNRQAEIEREAKG